MRPPRALPCDPFPCIATPLRVVSSVPPCDSGTTVETRCAASNSALTTAAPRVHTASRAGSSPPCGPLPARPAKTT
eukprot:615295-Rhodomonas_salina.1